LLVTADLGCDLVQAFRLDGRGVLHETGRAATATGCGPRHVAIAADARVLYVIGELDGDITVFALDPDTGAIGDQLQTVPTSPPGHTGQQSAAEIALHPSGRFLYASNRGSQTIAAYRVDPADGRLSAIGFTGDRIAGPTNFAIAPAGDRLYVDSGETDLVVPFRIDDETGRLEPGGEGTRLPAPNVMVIA